PRVFPLVGAVLLAVVDARRRALTASLVFGAGLVIVVLPRMLRSPALADVLPDAATTAVGVVLTLTAALAGGWLAARLAGRLVARKHVFMAVRRLGAAKCFLHLDPARLRGRLAKAATIAGAAALGRAVGPEALGHIDLIVAGSVAVDPRGARLGKGGGYSDLE